MDRREDRSISPQIDPDDPRLRLKRQLRPETKVIGRPRITIARWMGLISVLAVNAALVRSFVVREMFTGGILILITLQVGFWSLIHSRERVRRFWLGFEVSGVGAVLGLFACEVYPDSPLNRLLMSYMDTAFNLAFSHLLPMLPTPLADHLDYQQDQLLAVAYFVPELVAALLGGAIVVCLVRRPGSNLIPGDAYGMTPGGIE